MSSLAAARPARARLGRWPYDEGVAHLVLLDHQMVPTTSDVGDWIADATELGARLVRTGALFPNATGAFLESGFQVADSLALLTRSATPRTNPPARGAVRLRRLRPTMLSEAAAIDRRSFASPWANDASALGDIMTATPYHRSRSIDVDGRMVAFSISGRADRSGYIQRLAVDPSARRHGFAHLLIDDAVRWMSRRGVSDVMVNTAANNHAALALYDSVGFERQPGTLLILERALR
ncbi:MAG TPA: GNAT family N-acetyltransferase [Ilumatobacteraceae bacterium]|nr:GNAT family N-acetyltransferase [Ilumatobacteraceae bacterium]